MSDLLKAIKDITLAETTLNYTYERSRAALMDIVGQGSATGSRPDPHQGYALRYVNPLNGAWAMPTIMSRRSFSALKRGWAAVWGVSITLGNASSSSSGRPGSSYSGSSANPAR